MSIEKQLLRTSGYFYANGTYLFQEGMEIPADPKKELCEGRIIKDSRSVISGIDPLNRYFVKVYKKNGFWRTLKRSVQFPRSYRCLAGAIRLTQLGIATPKVLLASRYCLITEVLPKTVQFMTPIPERTVELIPFVARLHAEGIWHGDLNLRNIYCAGNSFGLIDMDSLQLYDGAVPEKVRFQELARVISSALKSFGCLQDSYAEKIRELSAIYCQNTGYDFYGEALLKRINFLVNRRNYKKYECERKS